MSKYKDKHSNWWHHRRSMMFGEYRGRTFNSRHWSFWPNWFVRSKIKTKNDK